MFQGVAEGQTLIVEGAARAQIVEGTAEILGAFFYPPEQIVVKRFKSLSIEALTSLKLEIVLGTGGKITIFERSTISPLWKKIGEEFILKIKSFKDKKSAVMMVIGDVDSGKSTFVTHQTNLLLNQNFRVGIIDADIGQSNIGPPTVISLGVVEKGNFVKFLSDIKLKDGYFVGHTSPNRVFHRVMVGLKKMVDEALSQNCDAIIIDTTGFVQGIHARELKFQKASLINPDLIVVLQKGEELESLLEPLERLGLKIERVPTSEHVRSRSMEERKELRKMSFAKHLIDGKILKLSLDERLIIMQFNVGFGEPLSREAIGFLEEKTRVKILHTELTEEILLIVVWDKIRMGDISEIVFHANEVSEGREVIVLSEKDLENLLVGLYGANFEYKGIGILKSIDYKKGNLTLYTREDPIKVSLIQLGTVQLFENGEEIGKASTIF